MEETIPEETADQEAGTGEGETEQDAANDFDVTAKTLEPSTEEATADDDAPPPPDDREADASSARPQPEEPEEAAAPLPQEPEEASAPLPQEPEEASAPLPQEPEEAAAPLPQEPEEAAAPLPQEPEEAAAPLPQEPGEAAAPQKSTRSRPPSQGVIAKARTREGRQGKTVDKDLERDREKICTVLKGKGVGSVLRGWRQVLDPDGSLDVGFQEFCRNMAQFNIQIDIHRLFNLEGDPKSLPLSSLCPVHSELLQQFLQWVKDTFGATKAMFSAFDPNGEGRVTKKTFFGGCHEMGMAADDEDCEELWGLVDSDNSGEVSHEEFLFLELDKDRREQEIAELRMHSQHHRQRIRAYCYWDDLQKIQNPVHRRAQRPWNAGNFENLPVLVCEKRLENQKVIRKRTIDARSAFTVHLRKKFGNEVRAWRRVLDPQCQFQVDLSTLRKYLRGNDQNIDSVDLWRSLDRDGDGYFRLEEIGVRQALVLAKFRHWAHHAFGSCANFWEEPAVVAMRNKPQLNGRWVSNKKMMLGSFSRAVKHYSWIGVPGVVDIDTACHILCCALDLYGCGFVSLPDLFWLDAWNPPEWLSAEADENQWADLRVLMLERYEQPLRAWRQLLDTDNSNEVSWDEFKAACKKVKFKGNVGAAWRALDKDVSGTISMMEYDESMATLLNSFKSWTDALFGSVELAFKSFDADGSGSLTFSELRKSCRRLGWQGEVRLLFNCLNCKKNLTLSDIVFLDKWLDDEERFGGPDDGVVGSVHKSHDEDDVWAPKAQARRGSSVPARGRSERSSGEEPGNAGYGAAMQAADNSALSLHKRYHVLGELRPQPKARPKLRGLAPRAPTQAPSSGSKLAWLEKLQRIDPDWGRP